jgi:D-amino peptidase
MNIMIMVDMEGISGICRSSQVMSDNTLGHYPAARRYFTWDINACVKGCFEGGAKKVLVRDAHASGFNMIWEEADPRADYIQGACRSARMPGIDGMDGMILLGYHAMGGTSEAVLEHTMSSKSWQQCYVNGKKSGEFAIDSIIAGEHGVPVIMTSGDDKLCAEAKAFLKDVVAVEVKKGLDTEGAVLLPKERAHKLIAEGAAKAVRNLKKMKPVKIKSPVTLTLEYVSRIPLPVNHPSARIVDGRTFEIKAPTLEKALMALG